MIDWTTISLKELAGYLSEELRKKGVDTILVGGACVTIYSDNRYQSYDLDYITYEDMRKVKKAILELGFIEKNQYFIHVRGLLSLFRHQSLLAMSLCRNLIILRPLWGKLNYYYL